MIREFLTCDHLSAICAMAPDGKLYKATKFESYTGQDGVRFLRHLLRHVQSPVVSAALPP